MTVLHLPQIWVFVSLLATHWVADFVLQTHWQASNKSKNNEALGCHVATYTGVLAVASAILFGLTWGWFLFVAVNGLLHFATDYYTSRWTSRLFGAWLKDTQQTAHIHNFFVVIGLDQFIHQTTLAATMLLIVQ